MAVVVKYLPANAGDAGDKGRSLGGGNPLQYYCLENAMDRWVWWAAVLGVTKSQTRLSEHVQSSLAGEEGRVNSLGSTFGYSLSSPALHTHESCARFLTFFFLPSSPQQLFSLLLGQDWGKLRINSSFYFSQDFCENWQDFVDSRCSFWKVGTWPHRDTLKVLFCGWASTFLSLCH